MDAGRGGRDRGGTAADPGQHGCRASAVAALAGSSIVRRSAGERAACGQAAVGLGDADSGRRAGSPRTRNSRGPADPRTRRRSPTHRPDRGGSPGTRRRKRSGKSRPMPMASAAPTVSRRASHRILRSWYAGNRPRLHLPRPGAGDRSSRASLLWLAEQMLLSSRRLLPTTKPACEEADSYHCGERGQRPCLGVFDDLVGRLVLEADRILGDRLGGITVLGDQLAG